jgi:hypothetical protein
MECYISAINITDRDKGWKVYVDSKCFICNFAYFCPSMFFLGAIAKLQKVDY